MQNGITLAITMTVILVLIGILLTILINVFIMPTSQTPRKIVKEIIDKMHLKKKDKLADLGCGDGRIITEAYKTSKCTCVGYDLSPIMVILAKIGTKATSPFKKNVTLDVQDIFKMDISDCTKVYCYLNDGTLKLMKQKLSTFIKNGGEVYSYKYRIAGIKKYTEEKLSNGDVLYIYK